MKIYIYRLTGSTKKSYIGVSKDPQERFKQHCLANSLIGKVIRKYGKSTFQLDVLDETNTYEKAYKLEQLYIEEIKTLVPGGYNLNSGGRGGMKNSEEAKRKNRKAHIGKKASDETIKKMQGPRTPRETRICAHPDCNITFEVIVTSKRKYCGRKCANSSPEKTKMMREILIGRIFSPETIERMSKSRVGRKQTPESIAKRVETNKRNGKLRGKKLSPESIKKRTETRREKGNYKQSPGSIQKMLETRKINKTIKELEKLDQECFPLI